MKAFGPISSGSFLITIALWVMNWLTDAALAAPQPAAPIAGRVRLEGVPPAEKQVTLDAATARLRPEGMSTRHYSVGQDGGLANVLVIIVNAPAASFEAPPAPPLRWDLQRGQWEPYVIAVRTGQVVRLVNQDPLLHNAGIFPKLNRSRSLALSSRGGSNDVAFDRQEFFVRVKCDVHPWEFGYVCVLDHPFFATTDADGKFALPSGLPPGKYVLEARHARGGSTRQEIIVGPAPLAPLELKLRIPPVKDGRVAAAAEP